MRTPRSPGRAFRCVLPKLNDARLIPIAMRYTILLALALPAATFAQAHTGVVKIRTHPEPSDIALFVMAGVGVWLVRRAMRARFAARRKD